MDGVIRLEAALGVPDRALVKHVVGLTRPASSFIRPQIGVGVVRISDAGAHVSPSRSDLRKDVRAFREAERQATDAAAAQRGGRRPSLGISVLMSGCPDTDDVHADESTIPSNAPATLVEGRPWTVADCLEFGRTCHALLREALPHGQWIGALHLDEKAVHYQVELVALVVDEAGTARVGNGAVREALVRLAPNFETGNARVFEKLRRREDAAAKRDGAARQAGRKVKKRRRWINKGPGHMYLTAEAQMRLVHDLYAHRFARFGIVRGKGGKRQHHERVDRGKAMESKLRSVQRAAEAAAERERAALAKAEEAEERERQAGAALERTRTETVALQGEAEEAEQKLEELQKAREVAGNPLTGRRSRRGQAIVADYERRIADRHVEFGQLRDQVRERDGQIEDLRGELKRQRQNADERAVRVRAYRARARPARSGGGARAWLGLSYISASGLLSLDRELSSSNATIPAASARR